MSGFSFEEAMDLAESMGLPDGAFWAMSHELAGLDYGEGFPRFDAPKKVKSKTRRQQKTALMLRPRIDGKPFRCGSCGKDFATKGAKKRHRKDVHPKSPKGGNQ